VKDLEAEGVQRTESCRREGTIFNISIMVEGLKRKSSSGIPIGRGGEKKIRDRHGIRGGQIRQTGIREKGRKSRNPGGSPNR